MFQRGEGYSKQPHCSIMSLAGGRSRVAGGLLGSSVGPRSGVPPTSTSSIRRGSGNTFDRGVPSLVISAESRLEHSGQVSKRSAMSAPCTAPSLQAQLREAPNRDEWVL